MASGRGAKEVRELTAQLDQLKREEAVERIKVSVAAGS